MTRATTFEHGYADAIAAKPERDGSHGEYQRGYQHGVAAKARVDAIRAKTAP